MIETNIIYNENNLETCSRIPDNIVDLVITSPPYDNLRKYNEYTWDFEKLARELFRITKDGGTIVWIVADETINGSESGSSFKQALFFKEIGFNLHDTMIWSKPTFTATGALKVRYAQTFEYMFVFTKGKIKTFNPIMDRPAVSKVRKKHGGNRQIDGSIKPQSSLGKIYTNEFCQRFNVWHYAPEMSNNNRFHPAQFPEPLIKDHILSWSNENDIIYDPFMGSGTTAKCCLLTNRRFIGSEISKEYCDIANNRIKNYENKNS